MPDHLHALVSFPQHTEMGAVIAEWKKFAARSWNLRWQEGFFDHRLRSDESARQKEEYIRQNPVRAGVVDKPEDWPYVWWPTAG